MKKRAAPVSALPALQRFKMSHYREAPPGQVIDPAERARVSAGLATLAESLATRQANQIDRKYSELPIAKTARLTAEYRADPPKVGPHLSRWIVENVWSADEAETER